MGYYNPILSLGEERSAKFAHDAGGDGFIIVDLPPEEAGGFVAACRANDMSFVPLVAPTTAEEPGGEACAVADAFIYCVSVTGTTGGAAVSPEALPEFLARVRRHTKLPLAVGFGVSTRAHVEAIGKLADAAVIGSAIIGCIDAATGRLRSRAALIEARISRRASGSLWRMFPAISGQVITAQREDNERRWAWRWPRVGRTYGCPQAGVFTLHL